MIQHIKGMCARDCRQALVPPQGLSPAISFRSIGGVSSVAVDHLSHQLFHLRSAAKPQISRSWEFTRRRGWITSVPKVAPRAGLARRWNGRALAFAEMLPNAELIALLTCRLDVHGGSGLRGGGKYPLARSRNPNQGQCNGGSPPHEHRKDDYLPYFGDRYHPPTLALRGQLYFTQQPSAEVILAKAVPRLRVKMTLRKGTDSKRIDPLGPESFGA